MSRLAISAVLAVIVAAITTTLITPFPSLGGKPSHYYQSLFLSASLFDNSSAARHLRVLTRRPHVAGTPANAEAAAYVLSTLTSSGVRSHVASYSVLLTYPVSRSLSLTLPPPGDPPETSFPLLQEPYENDPYADVANQVLPTFHGYAKSGTAAGPVVYANYGRVEDFQALELIGVDVEGKIIIARYGKIFRGDIVRNAHQAGAIGVVIFTDRKDYGGGGGGGWFPEGRWMPPSGVQVGTVYSGAGDPTTPGWASKEGCERLGEAEMESGGDLPLIPSLPISWADGETIMRSLGGGVAEDDWQGSQDDLLYRLGPGPGILNLTYSGEQKIATIENVIGVIEGAEEPDRYVLLGNHRDAWTFGAVDPNSGTAAMLEVAERFRKLQKKGWKPRRTIVLCNWDAEEYGLVGSTEWVEENREILASRAVAYLNVDCAVAGAGFHAASTPQLDQLVLEAARQVLDPDNSSQSIYDSWVAASSSALIDRLGDGGSDYAAFVQHVGVPSANFYFGSGYPVYHSMYDDYVWMEKFGDPMFRRNVAVASMWGLVALRLADEEFLPFNYLSYAAELERSAEELQQDVSSKEVDLLPLFRSIKELQEAAEKIDTVKTVIRESRGWMIVSKEYKMKVRELNDRLMMVERAFTDRDGLSSRPWYKHLIYGPSRHNDYGSKSFPGVDDAIEVAKKLNTAESWKSVQHEVWRVSRVIRHASLVLHGRLT